MGNYFNNKCPNMEIKRKYNFSLKPYGKNKDYYLIRLRVSYPGNRVDFSTGCNVLSEDAWNAETQRIKKGYLSVKGVKAEVQNKELEKMTSIMDDCFKFFEVQNRIPAPKQLKEYFEEQIIGKYLPEDPKEEVAEVVRPRTFWEIYDEFVQENGVKNAWTKATYEKFAAMRADLKKYKKDLCFEDLTEKGLTGFVCYLRDKKKIAPPKSGKDENGKKNGERVGLKNSTIEKKLSYLKWFLKWATIKGYNTNLAYQTFKVTLKSTQKVIIFLTKEELNKIKKLEIPEEKKYLDRVRDVFMFCCFSGIRYSDAYNLKKSDIKDGKFIITTVKTADSLTIELNNVTSRILAKYQDIPLEHNKALPVISNQTMNFYLKELCKLAGIDEPIRLTSYKGNQRIDEVRPKYELIGTHTGRRTFICQMLSLGVPAEIVMKWTGHSDYSAMKPYIDIVDKAKAAEMSKINILDED